MNEFKRKVEGSEEWFNHIKTEDSTDAQRMFSSESYFKSLWENAPHGMALVSEDATIIDANHSFCELLGIDYDQALGLCLKDFVADGSFREDRRMIETMVKGAMYSGMTEERWNYRLNPNGPYIPVRLIATRIPSTLSKPFRHIVIQIYDLRTQKYTTDGSEFSDKGWMEIIKYLFVKHFGKIFAAFLVLMTCMALNGRLGDAVDKIIDVFSSPETHNHYEAPHNSRSSTSSN